jgi:hypothetical protein
MSTQPLTPAELAAAEVLAIRHNASDATHSYSSAAFHGDARTVVAAVRGLIEADVLDVSAEDLEQMAEQIRRTHTAAQPNRPGLEIAAEVLRGRASAFRQSLSRPTSEEH